MSWERNFILPDDSKVGYRGKVMLNKNLDDVIFALQNNPLTELKLTYCELRDAEAINIASAIERNPKLNHTLEKLDLSGNHIGDSGAQRIAEALVNCTTLESLNLAGNQITAEGAKYLVALFKERPNLLNMDLRFNPTTSVANPVPHKVTHIQDKAFFKNFQKSPGEKSKSVHPEKECAEEVKKIVQNSIKPLAATNKESPLNRSSLFSGRGDQEWVLVPRNPNVSPTEEIDLQYSP